MNAVKMTPDCNDLMNIEDYHYVERVLQTSLKQQFYSYGIP